MSNSIAENTDLYDVLINEEQQYSMWPSGKALPVGWVKAKTGMKSECLEYIREQWIDMRPLSLRSKQVL